MYAPNDIADGLNTWLELKQVKDGRNGLWLFMSDFNEIRYRKDRFSMIVSESNMDAFNSFIREAELFDFKMGGRKFTWMTEDGKR